MKKCPYCAEEIQDGAIKCKHCGEMLDKTHPAGQTTTAMFEEEIIKEDKPALISYIGSFFFGGFFLLLTFTATVGWFFFTLGAIFIAAAFIYRDSIKYTITNKKIKVKRGILGHKVDEIDIAHIRNISLRQNFSGKILGYGDVLVSTAGMTGYEIFIERIKDPQATLTLIKDLQKS